MDHFHQLYKRYSPSRKPYSIVLKKMRSLTRLTPTLISVLAVQLLIKAEHYHIPIIYAPQCKTCILQDLPPIHNPPKCQYNVPDISQQHFAYNQQNTLSTHSKHYPHHQEVNHYEDESHNDHHKDHNVRYKFSYSVNDHKTGDVKHHTEERKGDVVTGEYALLEADGNIRTVKYYADWKSGFHAEVHNSKHVRSR